jgi:hypothetical protein
MAHTQSVDAIHPPTKSADDAVHQVQSATTGAAAASFDWGAAINTAYPGGGKCWITVEALTTPVYIRFGPTSTTATTTVNGRGIAAGTTQRFLVDPTKHRYIDHISSGAGSIKVQVDSYGFWDRRNQ